MSNKFWTNLDIEPKQNFKWLVDLVGQDIANFYATSVTKPNFQVQNKKFKNINIEENYPTNIVWTPVQVTLIDSTESPVFNSIINFFKNHNLDITSPKVTHYGVQKNSINTSFSVEINMLDNSGEKIEKWILENAIPIGLEMSQLNYKNDDLHTYKITFAYDWAKAETSESRRQDAIEFLTRDSNTDFGIT